MYFHDGRVHLDGFNLHANDLLFLQALKSLVQDTALRPSIHACVDGAPRAETLGRSTPFAALFSNTEQRVEKLQISHTYIATLPWQLRLNALELRLRDPHILTL